MVETSKILTVSYGTFSCTLEGFDDSFNTMKAIAEYFRDLASDDRYFGAEPPTPDAEMLARIAEKEISRRVEARTGADGVVLRPALSRPEAETRPRPEMPDLETAAPPGETSSAAISAAVSAAAAAPSRRQSAETGALSDHQDPPRTSAAREHVAPDVQSPAEAAPQAPALEDDEEAPQVAPEDSEVAPIAEPSVTADHPTDTNPLDRPDRLGEPASPQVQGTPDAPPTEAPAHPDADSVAAKLQRIRAVVSRDGAAFAGSDYTEDQGGTDETQMGQLPDVTDYAAAPATDPEDEIEAMSEAPAPLVERAYHRREDDITDVVEAEAGQHTAVTSHGDSQAEQDTDASTGPDAADEDPREAELAAPDLAVLDGADELDRYLGDRGDADLSPEEEAELLEAVTGDSEPGADAESETATDEADNADDAASTIAQPHGFAAAPEEDEEALTRLLDETNAQMKEPEGNRRRAAIAQLKAAVAATQAEGATGQAGDPSGAGEVENAFREDLDQVVRPRRAPRPDQARSGTQSERPRPAPLKLVAAQRVDVDREAPEAENTPGQPVQPVRPRRVQARDRAEGAGTDGFADFAERMGARELPDLLEAAAAYTAFIEGAEEFSRPQIIRRVRQVAPSDFNREDGLRSFADLLREGRLNKVRNGRFQVAEDTRFNPQRQAS